MFDWKRQRGSRIPLKTTSSVVLAQWLVVGLAVVSGTVPHCVWAAVEHVVVQAPAARSVDRDRLDGWANQDRRWLRTVPAGETDLSAALADTNPSRLRQLLAQVTPADGDSVAVGRPIEHRLRDRPLPADRSHAG